MREKAAVSLGDPSRGPRPSLCFDTSPARLERVAVWIAEEEEGDTVEWPRSPCLSQSWRWRGSLEERKGE